MQTNKKINILAISGSLRLRSSNTAILHFLKEHVPNGVTITFSESLASLPHFDPDATAAELPVTNFRQALQEANAVIICTPEYAFGIPGVLKNALDWAVSSGEFNEKPVAAISASPLPSGGDKALASLLLTLTALGTTTSQEVVVSISGSKKKINDAGQITDQQTKNELLLLLTNLMRLVENQQAKKLAI